QRFMGLVPARNGGLWITGSRGLARAGGPLRAIGPETAWDEFIVPEALGIENFQAPHEDVDGGLSFVAESVTNHQKLAAYFDGQHWNATPPGLEKLRHCWRGSNGTRWTMAIDSLLEEDESGHELSEHEEVSARQYFDVAMERNGNFWLATSEGLFRYAPLI